MLVANSPAWREDCFLEKWCVALARAPFFGMRRAKVGPRWRYVGAKLAYVGLCWPMLGLCWLMLAQVGAMLGLCWPMSEGEAKMGPR